MSLPANLVSIHPYFKVHPGKMEEFKAALKVFVDKVASEKKNFYYDFTVNGDTVFCREAYAGAEGFLEHFDNVGAMLPGLLTMADVVRVEVHGPAAELDKLKGPMAALKPEWFTFMFGVKR
jgi:quinol monooxygenase YgiN